MDRRPLPLALAALLAAAPLAARADDLATVRTRVGAAMQSAKSFVVTSTTTTGISLTMMFVAPDRFHSTLAYDGTTDVILVGQTAYVSRDGKVYRKSEAGPEIVASTTQLRDIPVDALLPDKPAAGKTWGRFATTATGPQRVQHLTCTYDKATYRINDCANETWTVTFTRYDDPANVIAAPANVVSAAGLLR